MQVEVNDAVLRCRVDGPSGAPFATFITGIANDLTMWDDQAEALKDEFRVLRFDLRGHGGSRRARRPTASTS